LSPSTFPLAIEEVEQSLLDLDAQWQ